MQWLVAAVCLLCSVGNSIAAQDIYFNLSNFTLNKPESHLVTKTVDLNDRITAIVIQDIPSDVGFILVQVHAYLEHVLLSNDPSFSSPSTVNGTNTGLIQIIDGITPNVFFVVAKKNVSALIAVVPHDIQDPIPGGCNLTFKTKIAPYQNITYTNELIIAEAQAASVFAENCEENNVGIEMYHLYLNEWDFTQLSYFKGIESMLIVDRIITNGRRVPHYVGYSNLRKYYNAYKGTGSVFAVIAKYKNRTSAYIPGFSYACDPRNETTCYEPETITWKVLCAIIFFCGILICFYGHSLFIVTLFLGALLFGAFISYIPLGWISVDSNVAPAIVAPIFGIIWMIIWIKYGMPIVSTLTTFSVLGFCVASMIFYFGLSDCALFRNDYVYWSVFICFILIVNIISIPFVKHGHIAATSFIGSYAIVWPIDHYIGSCLHYIILTALRRATVAKYNLAVVDPPVQMNDIALIILWIVLTACGGRYQISSHRNNAPYPSVSETTPLLRG